MAVRKIGIHWNSSKIMGLDTARNLTQFLSLRGVDFSVNQSLADELVLSERTDHDGFADCDILAVLGGDGTILRALDYAIPADLPILGINLGRLGFLTEVEQDAIESDLQSVLDGAYTIDRRMTMCVEGYDERKYFALNEIVIARATPEVCILSLEYAANGTTINRIAGDGLVVSTSTGSTAYSLSAGGPVIAPGLECFVLTPICPHMMNVRPVVLSASDRISIRVNDERSCAHAVLDSRKFIPIENNELVIRRSSRDARFVRLHDHNYFELLRGKLSEWTY